jgi:hypothetical protein
MLPTRRPNITAAVYEADARAVQGEMTRSFRRNLRGCVCTGPECLATGCPACYFLRRPGCVIHVRIEGYVSRSVAMGLDLPQETLERLVRRMREK